MSFWLGFWAGTKDITERTETMCDRTSVGMAVNIVRISVFRVNNVPQALPIELYANRCFRIHFEWNTCLLCDENVPIENHLWSYLSAIYRALVGEKNSSIFNLYAHDAMVRVCVCVCFIESQFFCRLNEFMSRLVFDTFADNYNEIKIQLVRWSHVTVMSRSDSVIFEWTSETTYLTTFCAWYDHQYLHIFRHSQTLQRYWYHLKANK